MKAQTLPVGSAGFFHGVNNSPGHQGGGGGGRKEEEREMS